MRTFLLAVQPGAWRWGVLNPARGVGGPTRRVALGMPVSLSEGDAAVFVRQPFFHLRRRIPRDAGTMNINTGHWLDPTAVAVRPCCGRQQLAATLVGELYAICGFVGSAKKPRIYNPASNTWRVGPDLPRHTASPMPAVAINGKIDSAVAFLTSKHLRCRSRMSSLVLLLRPSRHNHRPHVRRAHHLQRLGWRLPEHCADRDLEPCLFGSH